MSEEASVAAFADTYDLVMFEAAPTAYVVTMESSEASRVPGGLSIRMGHVPGVEQDIAGPWQPDGTPKPETVDTDMVAFFDAKTGAHLVTIFIGPQD